MSHLVKALRAHGDRIAVFTETERVSYAALADLVTKSARTLGTERRLVLLEARNDLPTLVHYLGALAGAHGILHDLATTPEALAANVSQTPNGLRILEVPIDRTGHEDAHAHLRATAARANA